MQNALTIDLENWYSNDFLREYLPPDVECEVVKSAQGIVKLLDKHNALATFFVLGDVAQRHPEFIEALHERGHEIASHSYTHTSLHWLGEQQFELELKRSTKLLKSITHESPIGFRAPNFSVSNVTRWVFPLLDKYGYKYDSSVFPFGTRLYGVPDAPPWMYRPDKDDITKEDPYGKIVEFPMTIAKFFVAVPVSGGFYLRTLPLWFLKLALAKINETRPAVIYIHPWETHNGTPRIDAPWLYRFQAYHGIRSALSKLEALLKSFEFAPMRDVLHTWTENETTSQL